MADPTKRALAVNEARIQFLRLFHGATDELSDDSVPAGKRENFKGHLEHHREFTARWFEEACNYFGASDGTWKTVPERRQADALRYLGWKIAEHDNRCQFELDLLKIKLEEQAEEAAMEDELDFG
ncbi:hypothetical protein IVB30_02075 [Bradyrhizobium sp. 200]|uniref:hypothetical protein n=1 Tax=Bradyrhizobium sp. 200 TaxID=2782665 RepID=UPI00200022EE|nr:hypothetical protein [Bradyrhizobium sp. 200]UPJ50245.1 hypothetical protein IVB30_02075 [Bradyrhizobium sp. 200]